MVYGLSLLFGGGPAAGMHIDAHLSIMQGCSFPPYLSLPAENILVPAISFPILLGVVYFKYVFPAILDPSLRSIRHLHLHLLQPAAKTYTHHGGRNTSIRAPLSLEIQSYSWVMRNLFDYVHVLTTRASCESI